MQIADPLPIVNAAFEAGSAEGATVIGSRLLFNWQGHGWLQAEVIRQNTDKRIKIGGVAVNFILQYVTGESTEDAKHVLDPINYSSNPNAGPNSWVLLIPTCSPTQNTEKYHVEALSLPEGWSCCPPPCMEELNFRASAGWNLVQMKLVRYWESFGWCIGTITAQNFNAARKINHEPANFIAQYEGEQEPAYHVLKLEDYDVNTDRNEDGAWALVYEYVPAHDELLMRAMDAQMITALAPQPFTREVRHQMDNCAGTNKSQYVEGGWAMLCLLAVLDVYSTAFSLPNHGKFWPDVLAQKIACSYNTGDTFNSGSA